MVTARLVSTKGGSPMAELVEYLPSVLPWQIRRNPTPGKREWCLPLVQSTAGGLLATIVVSQQLRTGRYGWHIEPAAEGVSWPRSRGPGRLEYEPTERALLKALSELLHPNPPPSRLPTFPASGLFPLKDGGLT